MLRCFPTRLDFSAIGEQRFFEVPPDILDRMEMISLKSGGSSPPSLGRFPRISLSHHWYYRAARGGERLPTFCLSSSQLAKGSPTRSRSPLAAYLGSASAPPPSPGPGR